MFSFDHDPLLHPIPLLSFYNIWVGGKKTMLKQNLENTSIRRWNFFPTTLSLCTTFVGILIDNLQTFNNRLCLGDQCFFHSPVDDSLYFCSLSAIFLFPSYRWSFFIVTDVVQVKQLYVGRLSSVFLSGKTYCHPLPFSHLYAPPLKKFNFSELF